MAAPSGIVWGSVAGNEGGRIGIYTSVSNTSNTQSKVTIEVWFWSNYTVSDSSNSYYFNNNSTSATTLIGSVSINHTNNTTGWSTTNQTKLGSYSYTYNRSTSAQKINCAAKFTGLNSGRLSGATMTVSTSYTIPALASYTVTYNANGGSGAPSSQTKYYDKALTLSSTKPTRDGYTFAGWSTSSTATTATYSAGGSYTTNAAATLYAVWVKNVYIISYNANGGEGEPSPQQKTASVNLTLSSTTPTRYGYTFLGWATSKTATTAEYSAGATFTTDANITLYAVWRGVLYTIKYDANGGTGTMADSTHTYGIPSALTENAFTRDGYVFIGWTTNTEHNIVEYRNKEMVDGLADSVITLYAVWSLADIRIYSDDTIECTKLIEDSTCTFPRLCKDGSIIASKFVEVDCGVMFSCNGDGIVYARQFVEKTSTRYIPDTMAYIMDNDDYLFMDNDGSYFLINEIDKMYGVVDENDIYLTDENDLIFTID